MSFDPTDESDLARRHFAALHLAALVESSDDAIISKNLDGTVLTWNRAAERMFGFTADEMVGRSIRILIPADRQQEEDYVLGSISAGQKIDHYETVRQHKNGSLLAVSLTVSPIRRADGVIIGASKIARDISERQRADKERQSLLKIAQEASALKDEFLATLSHELRTPLNSIVGYVRLLQMNVLPDDKRTKALDAVGRSVTSLTKIVEDVLDVSRIISGKLRLQIRSIDVVPVIHSAIETVRPIFEAKGLRMVASVAGENIAAGDPERLQQVLWNILTNAVKFTGRGGEIRVAVATDDVHVTISVQDTGIGIAPEFLPHVFERFRQGDGAITRSHGGLGLGLAISKHLMEMQAGTIDADSDGTGRGATFRIQMLRQPTLGSAGLVPVPQRPAQLDMPRVELAGRHILVVDDDQEALTILREVLEMSDATVVTADSAYHAVQLLETMTPDMLISDLGMPGMSGFELIDAVRTSVRDDIRNIPALALTAYARSEDRSRALHRGFNAHLAKPIEPDELIATVTSLARLCPAVKDT